MRKYDNIFDFKSDDSDLNTIPKEFHTILCNC